MLRVQDKARRQDATWWSVSPDGFGGDAFSAPKLIKVRWEIRAETFIGSIDRKELISDAVVFLGEDVSVGDYLALGDFTNPAVANPTTLPEAFKIQKYDEFTDLRSVSTMRRVML